MWYHVLNITFIVSTFSWIISASVLKISLIRQKLPSVLYCWVHSCIYHYIPRYQQIALTCVINNKVFVLQDIFYFYVQIHISQISQISTIRTKNPSLTSKTICDHMFSDPKLDYTFHIFLRVLGLYFVSYHMWQLST